MIFILYRAGIALKRHYKLASVGGIGALVFYTFNEGLRFGRGTDYNLYGMSYEDLVVTGDSEWDITFQTIARLLITFNIPWQGYVFLLSFVFILSTIVLLKPFKDVIPYALPLFILCSFLDVENMIKWFTAFAMIMIGISYSLTEGKLCKKFWGFCLLACTIHLAIIPLVCIYALALHYFKRDAIKPIWVLILYFSIGFLFSTDYMLEFTNFIDVLSSSVGDDNSRIARYGSRAEYWLSGGFAGTDVHTPFPSIVGILYFVLLATIGYKAIRDEGEKALFAYNVFVLGLILDPIGRQLELAARYTMTFFFFRAIIIAYIIKNVLIRRRIKIPLWALLLLFVSIINQGRRIFVAPFTSTPQKYLYVWNKGNNTYQKMYDMWIDDMYKADSEKKKKNVRF